MSKERHEDIQQSLTRHEQSGVLHRWAADSTSGSSKYLVWPTEDTETPYVMSMMMAEAWLAGIETALMWSRLNRVKFVVGDEVMAVD